MVTALCGSFCIACPRPLTRRYVLGVRMESLEKIQCLIDDFQHTYRNNSLPPILRGKMYSLYDKSRHTNVKADLYWPDPWPLWDKHGIYAIFSDEELLYIPNQLEDAGLRT
nr:hypothetical protein [Vibrio anguillarum]